MEMGETMDNVQDRNPVAIKKRIRDFRTKQKMPYEFKVEYAKIRAQEFVRECEARGLNYYISVGGLDSITLLCFLRSIHIDCPAISVSGLEDKSIQEIHKKLGVIKILPSIRYMNPNGTPHRWSKVEIINEFGFPVVSKSVAKRVAYLANPSERNAQYRRAIVTGETVSGSGIAERVRLPKRWLKLFAGYENERLGTNYQIPPFKISANCCFYLKEKPLNDWAKEHNAVPFVGLMASEGGQRELALKKNGCNYFGKKTIRSAPFAIFQRQDLLQLALDLNVPVPEIYGSIERKPDGTLYTTKAQRTGCGMCGFGIHVEKRPNRFDQLRKSNPKLWKFWMYDCCKDENGNKFGWARVLDYIGIPHLSEEPATHNTMQGVLEFGEEQNDICRQCGNNSCK